MDPVNRLNRRLFLQHVAMLSASTAGLTLLSSACGLLPYRPTRVPRIGYLAPGPRESRTEFVDAFLAGMRDLGYVEGQTISIDWRFTPAGSDARFPELAADLVRLPVDVIVTSATLASRAARQATSTIPIVAAGVAWPVETGLVASLARPGGNLTALSANAVGLATKHVELIRDVVPGLSRAAVLVDTTNPANDVEWDEISVATEQVGVRADRIDLRLADDLEAAFDAIVSRRTDAFIDAQNPLLLPVRDRFAALAQQHQLPGWSPAETTWCRVS